jgi:hypothetical protein
MIANVIQTNFSSGEVSPQIRGRVDINKYFNGVKGLLNWIVRAQGGITRRSGTKFVAQTNLATRKSRIIPFRYSMTQSYIIEFYGADNTDPVTNPGVIRVFKDGAIVSITGGNISHQYREDDLTALTFTQSGDVLFIAHGNYPPKILTRVSHLVWTLASYISEDGPYLPKETEPTKQLLCSIKSDEATLTLENGIDFVAGDVGKIITTQQNGSYRPAKILSRTTRTAVVKYLEYLEPSLTVCLSVSTYGGAKAIYADHSGYFVPSVQGRYVMCHGFFDSASYPFYKVYYRTDQYAAVANPAELPLYILDRAHRISDRQLILIVIAPSATFTSADVGRQIRLEFGGVWLWGTITTYTSTTSIEATFVNQSPPWSEIDGEWFTNVGRTDSFRLGAWSSTTGYPSVVMFHEQRLFFAKTTTQPLTIWGSVSSDYWNMAPTTRDSQVLDTSALDLTVASDDGNPIQWLCSGPVLLVGTEGSELQLKPTNISEPLTPTNFSVPKQTSYGSVPNMTPLRVGSTVLFLQRAGNKIRELLYNFQIDQFEAKDLTVVSEHILRQGLGANKIAHQAETSNILWCLLNSGSLSAMTYERDQEVVAWHRHQIAGYNAKVESIAIIPSPDGTKDDIYLVVKRTILSSTYRFIEKIEQEFIGTDKAFAFFVDAGLTYSGPPATTISGLTHLPNGTIVDVVADGVYIGTKVVNSSSITISPAASIVHVGFALSSEVEFLPWEGGSPTGGTSQGKMKRIHQLDIRVLDTIKLVYGTTGGNFFTKILASGELFSGDARLTLDQQYKADATVTLKVEEPYPATLLSVMPQQGTNE